MIGKLLNKEEKLSVIGLGYVGMPLAVTFAEKGISVIGFDLNKEKINKYLNGEDPTNEIGSERLKKLTTIEFTSNETKIREAKFHLHHCMSQNIQLHHLESVHQILDLLYK